MNPPLTKDKAKVKFNGHWETWYSLKHLQKKLYKLPLKISVDSRGVVLDKDGYIYVATTLVKMGELIQTSLGIGKRHDACSTANTVDILTNW